MYWFLIINKINKKCITLVSLYYDAGQQNIKSAFVNLNHVTPHKNNVKRNSLCTSAQRAPTAITSLNQMRLETQQASQLVAITSHNIHKVNEQQTPVTTDWLLTFQSNRTHRRVSWKTQLGGIQLSN
jgi:hypothetical protein